MNATSPIDAGRLAGLFCQLQRERFEGMLHVTSGVHTASIGFRDGSPISYSDPSQGHALGEELVERGQLTRAQYSQVIGRVTDDLVEDQTLAFCEHAIQLGFLAEHDAVVELTQRVRTRLIQVLSWNECRVDLEPGAHALPEGGREFPQSTGALVYMGVRTFYEEDYLERFFQRPERTYIKLTAAPASIAHFFGLDDEELQLVRSIDPNKPITMLGRPSDDRSHVLGLLMLLRLAEFCEVSSVPHAGASEATRPRTRPVTAPTAVPLPGRPQSAPLVTRPSTGPLMPRQSTGPLVSGSQRAQPASAPLPTQGAITVPLPGSPLAARPSSGRVNAPSSGRAATGPISREPPATRRAGGGAVTTPISPEAFARASADEPASAPFKTGGYDPLAAPSNAPAERLRSSAQANAREAEETITRSAAYAAEQTLVRSTATATSPDARGGVAAVDENIARTATPEPASPRTAPEQSSTQSRPALDATQEALLEAAARTAKQRKPAPPARRATEAIAFDQSEPITANARIPPRAASAFIANNVPANTQTAPAAPKPTAAVQPPTAAQAASPAAAQGPTDYAKAHLNELIARRKQNPQEAPPSTKRDPVRDLKQARELLRDQHYVRAEELLRALAQQEPANEAIRAYHLWSMMRAQPDGDPTHVEELRTLAKKLSHEQEHAAFGCYVLGHIYFNEKKDDFAEKFFRRAQQADKTNKDAERHVLILERRKQQAAEAAAGGNRKLFGIQIPKKS